VPPRDFEEWGNCFEYKYNSHNTPLPDDVQAPRARELQVPVEQKLYDLYVRATGQSQQDLSEDHAQLQPETHAQLAGRASAAPSG
jgi:hypothetical protein